MHLLVMLTFSAYLKPSVAIIARALRLCRAHCASLLSFTLADLLRELHASCTLLGLGPAGHHPYSRRHGVVSHDRLHRRYSLQEAQRRGRLISQTSLRRYAKETRLLSEMNKLNPALVSTAQKVETNFAAVLSGSADVDIPSQVLVAPHNRPP